jgi:hypothetical protein
MFCFQPISEPKDGTLYKVTDLFAEVITNFDQKIISEKRGQLVNEINCVVTGHGPTTDRPTFHHRRQFVDR